MIVKYLSYYLTIHWIFEEQIKGEKLDYLFLFSGYKQLKNNVVNRPNFFQLTPFEPYIFSYLTVNTVLLIHVHSFPPKWFSPIQ